jgi:TolB protein
MAPNGSMVLFGTVYRGQNVLGMAATDGSIQLRLPSRNGEVQDPAWSPFLS